MKHFIRGWPVMCLVLSITSSTWVLAEDKPTSPGKEVIPLFNGKNLDGLYTWLTDTKHEDPRKVFSVKDGMLHVSGDGFGYICTKKSYRDYRLVVEYRWGEKTWGKRAAKAKDSGVLVHCRPLDNPNHTWLPGIEAQIIEGGVGDFIVVPAKRTDGTPMSVSLTAETTRDRDGELVWKKGGERVTRPSGRINWYGRDVDWADKLGFRGKLDLDSPGQEWTRLEIVCDGGYIGYYVNGKLANEGFDASPSAGQILLQTEGAELFYRRVELHPLKKDR